MKACHNAKIAQEVGHKERKSRCHVTSVQKNKTLLAGRDKRNVLTVQPVTLDQLKACPAATSVQLAGLRARRRRSHVTNVTKENRQMN